VMTARGEDCETDRYEAADACAHHDEVRDPLGDILGARVCSGFGGTPTPDPEPDRRHAGKSSGPVGCVNSIPL
jgi:hypothetical protein